MTLADGVYTWAKAQLNLTAGDIEFKVVKNHSWDIAYPAQNYVVNIAEAGEYTLTITFDPTTEAVAAEAVKKVIPQYEVAEAIAAGLAENDEILVRGVITKMEFKGKNFAKFGSVNIYVADATGAEGAFEFYNCYSLNADTFRTSDPAYDAESTAWAEFDEVADENGNAIHVGDTVIAFGKYKLYNETHELNTGCYLTEIKHPEDAPVVDEWAEIVFTEAVAADDIAEDASFLRLETEEESDADADEQITGPESPGIGCGEDMIHPIGGEIIGAVWPRRIGDLVPVHHDIPHYKDGGGVRKLAKRLDDKHYRVTLRYDRQDETEMVIRILSFGSAVRVTEPELSFLSCPYWSCL